MEDSIRLHPKHGLNPTIPICFFCGKPRNEVVLLGNAYRDEAPMEMCIDHEPCDECKAMMEMGVMLVSVKDNTGHENPYRTGNVAVVKVDAAKQIFGESLGDGRFAFVEDAAWDKLGLPR
jgi:hypothetical protein